MKNIEKLRQMSEIELINFISKIISENMFENNNLIGKWFENNYCKKCPTTEVILKNDKIEHWNECDFDGKCPHQDWSDKQIIKLYLNGECE